MARPIKIPESKKATVARLENTILLKSSSGEIRKAKNALDDLCLLLEKYNQRSRLMQAYLVLYEGALEGNELELAKRGFQFVRERVNKRTRIYLEATVLLAIAHLRERDLFAAEPLMYEVLNNDKFVHSETQRKIFIREVVDRFDQEGALTALSKVYQEPLPEKEVHERAIDSLKLGLSESEMEEGLGGSIPEEARNFILRVNRLARKQLPSADRLCLPLPREVGKHQKIGNLLFRSVKRRLHRYICDKDSDVYQAWLHEGLDTICSKSYVSGAVIAALADLRIGAGAVAIWITSLVIKTGLHNFCNLYTPSSLLSLRNSKPKN